MTKEPAQHTAPELVKITRPLLPSVYQRERLFKILKDAHANHQCIWIKAPPGSGKTTLVADYLEHRLLPVLWYSIDSEDNDVATFFHYLRLAVEHETPHQHGDIPHLSPEYIPGLKTFTRRYFEAVYTRMQGSFALVLDNYQDIADDALLHSVVGVAIANVPQTGIIIVISRNEPPPDLARLRTNGNISLIDWEALRLTTTEAAGIAKLRHPQSILDIQTLYELADGWVAGLILLLEQGTSRGFAAPASSTVPQVLFDYFAGELFDKLDHATQKLLMYTAFLPIMTESAVSRLAGVRHDNQILNEFYHQNYFISRHGKDKQGYQYHPLFRQFLLHRAEQFFTYTERVNIMSRAAVFLEEEGFLEEAVGLLRDANQWAEVIRLGIAHASRLISEGRNQTLLDWVSSVPPELCDDHPWIWYWRGVADLPFNPSASREHFEQAMSHFDLDVMDQRAGFLLAWSTGAASVFLGATNFTPLAKFIHIFDTLTDEIKEFPDPIVQSHVTIGMYSTLYLYQPDHPNMGYWADRAMHLLQSQAEPNLRVMLATHIVVQCSWWGDRNGARLAVEAMHEIDRAHPISALSKIHVAVCEALYDWLIEGTTSEWLGLIEKNIALSNEFGIHIWEVHVYGHGAACAMSIGNLASAEKMLKDMHKILDKARVIDYGYYQYLSMWLSLLKQDIKDISTRILSSDIYIQQVGMPFTDALMHHIATQALCKLGRLDDAEERLRKMSILATRLQSHLINFMCNLTAAQIALDRGDNANGRAALAKAMEIGRENNLINIFGWQPSVMARLCVEALEAGIELDYVRYLVRIRRLVPKDPPITIKAWPWPVRIFTLGRFDIEVDDQQVTFSGKAQKKPLEMLQLVVASGGHEISEARICEALWPDADGDSAHMAFNTTLHRLRKLLNNDSALKYGSAKLSLNPALCWIDARAFERLVNPVQTDKGKISLEPKELNEYADKVLSLYQGNFLANESEQPLILSTREILRSKFVQCIEFLGRRFEESGDWLSAMDIYRKGLECDSSAEALYRGMMLCHEKLGRVAEIKKVYEQCRMALETEYSARPSPDTVSIFRRNFPTG